MRAALSYLELSKETGSKLGEAWAVHNAGTARPVGEDGSARNLVAGISHEANTPIGVIKNNAGLSRQALDLMQQELEKEGLMDRLGKNGTWTRALDILNTSARTTVVASERISNLVTNLKQFSHLDEAELQIDDVAEGIESTLMLLRPQLAPGIDIRKELAELPKIECYASELNQCFMTLLVNASDALDGEGSITIKTSADDAGIFIETSDTGRGILDEKLANPFEIMFSHRVRHGPPARLTSRYESRMARPPGAHRPARLA